jgi:hypothetical protein
MSQNSLVIPNTGTLSGLTLVNNANAAFDSLNTLNSGGSGPSTTQADMWWMDTTNGLLKQRDGGNAIWLPQGVRGVAHGGGLRHSGQSGQITSNTTLDKTFLGQLIQLNPSAPITVTLPVANTYPAGTGFILANFSAVAVTLATQSGNVTDSQPLLGGGDQLFVVSDGVSAWRFLFRSQNVSTLTGGLSSSGFLRHPNGIIEQWGTAVVTTNGGGGGTVTWPEAFPTAAFSAVICPGDNSQPTFTMCQLIQSQFAAAFAGFATNVFSAPVRINFIAVGK